MKPLIAVMFAVLGAAAVAAAQGQARRGNVPVVPPVPDPPAQVVSGCLKPAPNGPGYVLAEAAEIKQGQPGGASGTSGSKGTYSIVGMIPPEVKLSSHVNHKVEISGIIADGTKLDVRALKMVAATCP